jgi:uncharacterized membrane protein
MKDGFAELKAHVESVYSCLGITCADVGAFQNSAGIYTGMEACTDSVTPDEDDGCPTVASTDAPTPPPTTTATDAPTPTPATVPPTPAPTSAPTSDDADEADTTAEPKEVVEYSYAFAALPVFVVALNA